MSNRFSEQSSRPKAASDALKDVVDRNTKDMVTFGELKTALHERGFGLIMLIFSLPLVLVPPGVTFVAAFPILFFSLQLSMASDSPWLPKWLANRSIKRQTLAMIVTKASPILKRAETFIRPRLYFASSSAGERVIGICALLCSISIAVPFPFTNLMPSIGIGVMSLGLLSKDGITILLGMLIGLVGCAITFFILILGPQLVLEFIESLWSMIGF